MKVSPGSTIIESQQDPFRLVRQRMNSVRVSEPLIVALIERPGLGASARSMSEAVDRLSAGYRKATEDLLEIIAPNQASNAMYRAVVSRTMARVIALLWKSGSEDNPEKLAERAVTIVRPLIETIEPTPDQVFTDLPAATREAIGEAAALTRAAPALLRLGAMPPKARTLLVGQHSVGEVAERIRSILREFTQGGAASICGAEIDGEPGRWMLTESQASTVRSGVRSSVAGVLIESLDSHIESRMKALRAMQPAERVSAYKSMLQCPQSWGVLDRVETDIRNMCETVLFRAARSMHSPSPSVAAKNQNQDEMPTAVGGAA
jgi:hypothetical protein